MPADVHSLLLTPAVPQGATVSASDISSSMAGEAQRRYEAAVAAGAKAPKVGGTKGSGRGQRGGGRGQHARKACGEGAGQWLHSGGGGGGG